MSDPKENSPKNSPGPESANRKNGGSGKSDPREQAIKYKAFRHTFSEQEIRQGLNQKQVNKKLRRSNSMVERYHHYLELRKQGGVMGGNYPWLNPFNQVLFTIFFWLPRMLRLSLFALLLLVTINYLPGPTQHIVELIAARAVYDTAPIARLPDSLESYAHSARIVDREGNTIKSYGRRQVTTKVPDSAKKAVLACEDHHFLPHPGNPWYTNAFLIHPGVSWFNLAGAVRDTLAGNTRGASTVVMQNAKKIVGNTERTIANKLEEIILSYMLVSRFGKDKNLDFYINTVPVGGNIYGLPAAAENYFRKELSELNYQQLVAIGSFIPNHFRQIAFYRIARGQELDELDPALADHARAAMNKVNLALGHLLDQGEISKDEYRRWYLDDEESIRRIGFRDFSSPLYGQEEWSSWNVIREITSRKFSINGREISGSRLLLDEPGDVLIETAINLDLTEKSKEIIAEFLASPEYQKVLRRSNRKLWPREQQRYQEMKQTPPFDDFEGFMELLSQHVNAGVIAVNQRGEIVSYVGGKEFAGKTFADDKGADNLIENQQEINAGSEQPVIIDLMNRQATVTPSSTIKPVVGYYSMVAAEVDPEHSFADQPLELKYLENEGRKVWLPRNWYGYDKKGNGTNRYLGKEYNLAEALVLSVNTIFARLYTNRLVQGAMLNAFDRIGLRYNRSDARYWPFGIGASDVPLQQWLGVYNAFLSGEYREPSFVVRITVNGRTIFEREEEAADMAQPLFSSRREREMILKMLYEVGSRGTGAAMRPVFPYHRNLVSGKTGTAPQNRSALFVSHFNPQRDRQQYPDETITMMVLFTTNSGGFKSVGGSVEGPVKVSGGIYSYLFHQKLQKMMDEKIEEARRENSHFRNNHVYWANVNRYMDSLLKDKCPDNKSFIHEYVVGVDGFAEAVVQILNPNNRIYTGKDEIFKELVRYYCDQEKVIKM